MGGPRSRNNPGCAGHSLSCLLGLPHYRSLLPEASGAGRGPVADQRGHPSRSGGLAAHSLPKIHLEHKQPFIGQNFPQEVRPRPAWRRNVFIALIAQISVSSLLSVRLWPPSPAWLLL